MSARLGPYMEERIREGTLGLWGFWRPGDGHWDQHVLITRLLSPGHSAPAPQLWTAVPSPLFSPSSNWL